MMTTNLHGYYAFCDMSLMDGVPLDCNLEKNVAEIYYKVNESNKAKYIYMLNKTISLPVKVVSRIFYITYIMCGQHLYQVQC